MRRTATGAGPGGSRAPCHRAVPRSSRSSRGSPKCRHATIGNAIGAAAVVLRPPANRKALHSLALIDFAMCTRLIQRAATRSSWRVRRWAVPAPASTASALPDLLAPPGEGRCLAPRKSTWPSNGRPTFTHPPRVAKWVIVPWEFGRVPAPWLGPLTRDVDEFSGTDQLRP